MMTVADYIARFLVSKGVRHVFGFQGSAVLKLIDAMVGTGNIEYIQNFNEQASAFAADAYARIRGDLGVAIATSGPGAVNLISGIANAYFDSIPVLFITGQDYLAHITQHRNARQNGFQDLDIISMIRPISKYAVLITEAERIRYELEKACWLAENGRKGSVVVDIPIDIQFKEIDVNSLPGFTPEKCICFEPDVEAVLTKLETAERPLILAGGGLRLAGALSEFETFLNKSNIPVITTLNAVDLTVASYGFSGLHGHTCANLALKHADLVLALGTRFGHRQIGKNMEQFSTAECIRVDIDPNEFGRTFVKENLALLCDLKTFLQRMNTCQYTRDRSIWHTKLTEWREVYADTVCLNEDTGLDPIRLVREVAKHYAPNAVLTTDVGANQIWTVQGFTKQADERLLCSSGFGAMGYSLPAAIGASYLVDSAIICFTGDGGLQMNLQELNTLSLRRNNIKCIVFNNNTLGMMLEVQDRYYHKHHYGTTEQEFTCPDLKKLAACFGLEYITIHDANDLSKLKEVFANNQPWLVDVCVAREAKVSNRYDDIVLATEEL